MKTVIVAKADLIKARDDGMSRKDAAKSLGITYDTINRRIGQFGIKWAHGTTLNHREVSGRELSILMRKYDGETLAAIGADYGLTRERVRQILQRIGKINGAKE